MKKLKLELDALQVESFRTWGAERIEGTVHGLDNHQTVLSCRASCIETGCDTCDNSLDYCTCNCSNDCWPIPTQDTPDSCPCYQEP